jgi:hypothetical protein
MRCDGESPATHSSNITDTPATKDNTTTENPRPTFLIQLESLKAKASEAVSGNDASLTLSCLFEALTLLGVKLYEDIINQHTPANPLRSASTTPTKSYAEAARTGLPTTDTFTKIVPKRAAVEAIFAAGNESPAQRARGGYGMVADINKFITQGKALAARRLPSGDITVTFDSENTRKIAEKSQEVHQAFGPGAHAKRRSYPVVAHGVPVNAINTHRQQEAIERLYKNNPNLKNEVEIVRVAWRHKTRKLQKTAGPLLICVAEPAQANRLIDQGLILDYQIHNVEVFSGDCNITQCFRCYEYGHTAKHCRNTEICGRCACATHKTNECEKQNGTKRCVNCTKAKLRSFAHAAWEPSCPIRADRVNMAKTAYLYRPHRYQDSGSSTISRTSSPGSSQASSRKRALSTQEYSSESLIPSSQPTQSTLSSGFRRRVGRPLTLSKPEIGTQDLRRLLTPSQPDSINGRIEIEDDAMSEL